MANEGGHDRDCNVHCGERPPPSAVLFPLCQDSPPATVLTCSSDRSRPRRLAADRNRGPVSRSTNAIRLLCKALRRTPLKAC